MAYRKPAGYRVGNLITGAQRYKRYNNSLAGAIPYLPGAPSAKTETYNFTAAPADTSTLTLGGVVFTFTYGGAPGAGIIPLVGGGGTAAQAAAATKLAVETQLPNVWSVTVATSFATFTARQIGINPAITPSVAPASNMAAITGTPSTFGNLLPARFGKSGAFVSG